MPLARDVGKPQQPLLDSVVTSEELLTVLGQLNALKGFVHANIHQNGPSSYQSSEKGRIQVLSEHFWPHLVETKLLSLGLFRKLKCKKESLCWP